MGDFFDKAKQSIGKGITKVSVKSKEMLETTKLKGQIGTLCERKKGALEELGNVVYIMFLKNTFDQERIKAKCEAIKVLDSQIKEKEEELKEIHRKADEALGKPKVVAVCGCGADIYEGAKFCAKCGKKIGEIAKQSEKMAVTEKVCSHCGSPLSSESKFCMKCGGKVE